MNIRHAILTASLALAFAGSAFAQELKPAQDQNMDARGIDLGAVSGIAYYTVEPDGFRVTVTLSQQSEDAVPVRVVAVLAPGQSMLLSTPHAVGEAPEAVEISRQADAVFVREARAVATN